MKRLILPVLSLLALFSCAKELDGGALEQTSEAEVLSDGAAYVDGHIIVEFSDEMLELIGAELTEGKVITKSMGVNSLVDELGITSIKPVFDIDPRFVERSKKAGLHRFYYVSFDESTVTTKAASDFLELDGILSAEPENKVKINDFNDPKLSSQWHYINDEGIDINVKPVWDNYTTGSPDITVAVIDAGVDLSHEDLAANCIAAGSGGSKNFAKGTYSIDADDHGTHVAGTIAAVNNNGKGVCGIAGGNAAKKQGGVKIMSCEILADDSSNNSADADAFRWACDNGALIAQNSWGYDYDTNNDGKITGDELTRAKAGKISSSLKAAVDYFITYAGCDSDGNQKSDSPMKGGIVFFAAGNNAIEYGAPANYEKVMAVGAVDKNGYKASFSNYGDWVDICAPGVSIMSTTADNSYGTLQGTSMACPHVSGVAALVIAYCGGQNFTNEMLWNRLIEGANASAVSSGVNIGPLVDAMGAISYGASAPDNVTSFTAEGQSNNINFTWNLTGDDEGTQAYGAMLYAAKEKSLLEKMTPSKPGDGIYTANVITVDSSVGDEVSGTIAGLEFDTSYYVTIVPYTYSGVYGSVGAIKTATTGANNPPVIELNYEGDLTFKAYQTAQLPLSIYDPDGHDIEVSYKNGSKADSLGLDLSNNYLVYINAPKADAGSYTAEITATDSYGASTTYKLAYTIKENQPPIKIKDLDNRILSAAGQSFTLDMSEYFTDPDDEPLTYSVSIGNTTVLHSNRIDNSVIIAALALGASSLTISATDAKGATTSITCQVLVRDSSIETIVYPNPVKTNLYISTGLEEQDTKIKIFSATGAKVYEGTQTTSAFNPATIDLSKCAPGRYFLKYSYGSKDYEQTIVKK